MLENVTFNIPEEYQENKEKTMLDFHTDNQEVEGLRGSFISLTKENNYINITIMYSDNNGTFSQPKPIENYQSDYKTINNKEGVLTVDQGAYFYAYYENGKVIQILTNDEGLLSQTIA